MNDITALMAAMKAAAENLDGDTWHDEGASVYGGAYDVGDTVCYDHIVDCENVNGESLVAEFIAIANPANVKTLAEALEKAQQHEQEWKSLCEAAAVDLDYWREIDDKSRGLICKLADAVIAKSERIAELESHTVTVKLPEAYGYLRENDGQIQISIGAVRPSDRSGGYATPWFAIYTAAGIQVIEGEGQ